MVAFAQRRATMRTELVTGSDRSGQANWTVLVLSGDEFAQAVARVVSTPREVDPPRWGSVRNTPAQPRS